MNYLLNSKRIVLKFGGKCDLSCPRCHNTESQYTFNQDIIRWINKNGIQSVFLSGGEPFLYFNEMKSIIPKLTTVKSFCTTTNGTLLNNEMVDFCNKYNISVGVSYDGPNSQRDGRLPNYEALNRINRNGVSQVVYHGNMDFNKVSIGTKRVGNTYNIQSFTGITNIPVFVHQTKNSPNEDTTREDAKSYIQQYARRLELGLMNYDPEGSIFSLGAAYAFIRHFINHKPYEVGCRCCNPNNITVTIDGRFLLCPYGDTYVGDIYKGVDWDLVESHIPDKCKTCPFKLLCGPSCIANITDNECYIFRVLYCHYKKLLKKYNIDETALLNRPEWSEE